MMYQQCQTILTKHNKYLHVAYAGNHIDTYKNSTGLMYYNDYKYTVHSDEKWFFMTELDQASYLTPGEAAPKRLTRHQIHVTKVIFLCVVGCPQFNANGNCVFNRKFGVWLFVKREQAKRTSNNRVKGMWETKVINVTYYVYLDFMLEKVLPAMKALFQRQHSREMNCPAF
jgi:hypothetical protein